MKGETQREVIRREVNANLPNNLQNIVNNSIQPVNNRLDEIVGLIERNYKMSCKIQNFRVNQQQRGLFTFFKADNANDNPPRDSVTYQGLFEMNGGDLNELLDYYGLQGGGNNSSRVLRIIRFICGTD